MDTFLCPTLFLLSFGDSDGTNVTVLDRPLLSSGGKGEPGGKGFCFRRVGATFTYLDIITNAQELPEEAFYIQYWCPRPTVTKYNKLSGFKKMDVFSHSCRAYKFKIKVSAGSCFLRKLQWNPSCLFPTSDGLLEILLLCYRSLSLWSLVCGS